MLKISKIAKHTTQMASGCSKYFENTCGIMYRTT